MQEDLTTELLKILRGVKILSSGSLSFAGKVSSVHETPSQNQPNLEKQNFMVQHLGRLLYLNCYCRSFEGVIADEVIVPSRDEEFVRELSAANTSCEYLNRGWRMLHQLPTGHYIAEKNGLTRTLFAGEFISHHDLRGPLQEGTSISIFCPRESKTMHAGFYYIFGEAVTDEGDDRGQLRFYWNIKSPDAKSLVRLLTQRLNRFQLPFRLKVVNDPAAYTRSDAGVLYVNKRYYHLTSELLVDVHQQLSDRLESRTPLFSKKLAAGLGLAEEPMTGESFGQQRCRLLAQAIWSAYELNLKNEQQQLLEIAKHFELNGINLDFPHLNPESTEDYEFPIHNS